MAVGAPSAGLRVAAISDIHGNLHALEAVLAAIEARGIEAIVCLGDVVGYGADPERCVQAIREREIPTVAGNHDRVAAGLEEPSDFNLIAQLAIGWTAEQLSESSRTWLAELPLTLELPALDLHLAHANPALPATWQYVLDPETAEVCLQTVAERVSVVGHSHIPAVFELFGDDVALVEGNVVRVRPGGRYLVNAGSVGQPRDGAWQAGFAVLEPGGERIEIVRVDYDLEGAGQAIVDAGLPPVLARRLGEGR